MSILHFLLMILVVAVWGCNFVAVELALKGIQPITLCFVRFFLLCFPAIFFIKRPAPIKLIFGYAVFLFILQFSLLFMGMYAGINAGLASLVLQFQVFFTVIFAVVFLKEKASFWQLVGALIAFTGISIIGIKVEGDSTFMGFVLILCASACWGFGNLFAKRLGKVNMIALVIWASLLAWPPLLILAILFEGMDTIVASFYSLSWTTSGALLYIIVGSTLFGYAAWGWLLARYPVSVVVPFTVLVPVFGILSSALILGESMDSWKILSALLIISGFCINMWMPQWQARKNTPLC